MERVRSEGSGGDRGGTWGIPEGNLGGSRGPASLPASPPQRLSLEQRTERLVQRSQALLRPRSRGPERAGPLFGSAPSSSMLDDVLIQWRSRRCRRAEPALDTPLLGGTLLGSAAPQGALQGVPRGRSRDQHGARQGLAPWESRDPSEAQWPIRRHFRKQQGASAAQAVSQEPFWQEPCWRSHDSHKAHWPMRSSSLDTLQGSGYLQSRDSHEALWQSSSCCASAHQGAPLRGKQESHEPLRHEPFWELHDCLGALQCAPYGKSHDFQDTLRPVSEAHPELLCRGAPGLESCDPCKAPQPIQSSAGDALQGAPLQQPLGPSRLSWNAHLCTPNPWWDQ
ncbi:histone H3-like centromeric protein A isoform X2 [Oenanthe melanoleuca]|uniref:histone H3-like centromeric protein A isoform X2 n=1 Tax=Oenanthe melanoleuca TaxID=2939378 RepID=UPI0024C18076|nr:histone H3-like centromeric protein A isoform X2 [Oenanthe melanoleuca]XP_056365785.1 histone H3-like centromeric protein A isoform X2 [Oenanthe melanoleuca]